MSSTVDSAPASAREQLGRHAGPVRSRERDEEGLGPAACGHGGRDVTGHGSAGRRGAGAVGGASVAGSPVEGRSASRRRSASLAVTAAPSSARARATIAASRRARTATSRRGAGGRAAAEVRRRRRPRSAASDLGGVVVQARDVQAGQDFGRLAHGIAASVAVGLRQRRQRARSLLDGAARPSRRPAGRGPSRRPGRPGRGRRHAADAGRPRLQSRAEALNSGGPGRP